MQKRVPPAQLWAPMLLLRWEWRLSSPLSELPWHRFLQPLLLVEAGARPAPLAPCHQSAQQWQQRAAWWVRLAGLLGRWAALSWEWCCCCLRAPVLLLASWWLMQEAVCWVLLRGRQWLQMVSALLLEWLLFAWR